MKHKLMTAVNALVDGYLDGLKSGLLKGTNGETSTTKMAFDEMAKYAGKIVIITPDSKLPRLSQQSDCMFLLSTNLTKEQASILNVRKLKERKPGEAKYIFENWDARITEIEDCTCMVTVNVDSAVLKFSESI